MQANSYPPEDCYRKSNSGKGALISGVDVDSPAYDAGFEAGCYITHVDGQMIRDIIDWRWLSADDEISVSYIDLDDESGTVELFRNEGESWGFHFEGMIFDAVKTCRNACTFCFMRQLPSGMRSSLSLKDDDFRLSFLTGTFVTLTNLTPDDEARIIEQRISPLRVSLHAVDLGVRRGLIGKHADHGLAALKRLLDAGIEFDAQIVLVPDVNDGNVLSETIQWAYDHPGIANLGIVPLGFTKHQKYFKKSFDAQPDAMRVIDRVVPFQKQAMIERGKPWVYAADEFYRNAYGNSILENLPDADFYCGYPMFEDGIGIIRSSVDEFMETIDSGMVERAACEIRNAGVGAHFICGEAMQPYFDQLMGESPFDGVMHSLTVKNGYFGGNVNVTGLLCGCDMISAIRERSATANAEGDVFFIPDVVFNADGLTLDGITLDEIRHQTGLRVYAVKSNPLDYIQQIIELIEGI